MGSMPEMTADAAEETSRPQKMEAGNDAAAGWPSSLNGFPNPAAMLLPRPRLEELIRVVTKFENPEQSRVVDVFE